MLMIPQERLATLVGVASDILPDNSPITGFWRSLFQSNPNYPIINLEWIHLNQNVNWMGSGIYEHSVFIGPICHKFW